MTEELLEEFQFSIESWTLVPSDGGRFEVEVNGVLLYSKLQTGRHAEVGEIRALLKQALNRG
jgi:selenoprotein W-related protein